MSIPSILLVDDHKIFRSSLKSLINIEKIGTVIGEASNGKEYLEILEKKTPDLVLMDIDMPVMDGSEATTKAREKYPNLKTIVLSMFGDDNYYYKMIKSGVNGFILKTSDVEELENAIKVVVSGGNYFSNELLSKVISGFEKRSSQQEKTNSRLTNREVEVIKLICNGLTNEEMAEKFHLSPKTVKNHRANLMAKTGCKNAASMAIYAIKNKLIEV
jgi:DNA-binding NarL/FixJ family response regulator